MGVNFSHVLARVGGGSIHENGKDFIDGFARLWVHDKAEVEVMRNEGNDRLFRLKDGFQDGVGLLAHSFV